MSVPIIEIDKSRCILCGVCEALSALSGEPIFRQHGISIEIDQHRATEKYDYTLLCIDACPTTAILKKRPTQ